MNDKNSFSTVETAAKTETANITPAPVEQNAQTSNALHQTVEIGKEEELDDEEYEVEYVYEDEDEEQEENSEEVIEVDEESDPTERQQETLPLDDEDEDVVEVYEEYDEEEEAVDDAEFDRIANRIDELLSKTSTLQAHTTPTLSGTVLSSEPMSEDGELEIEKDATPVVAEEKVQPSILKESPMPVDTGKEIAADVKTKQLLPTETISQLTQKEKEENVDDEEYEVEYVDEEEEEEIIEVDKKPQLLLEKTSPPIERSSTVEDSSSLSLPGQLRHVNNQWNISDLHDEEMLDTSKDNNEDLNRDETMTPVGDLGVINEEDIEKPNSNSKTFYEQTEPREMPQISNRLVHQSLSEAMADEDEINEIEIALEDWKEGNLERVLEGEEEEEEEEEEEDENDEVDPVMPDNLLLHANDQIEQIDVPMTPSPTPSYPGSPTTRRPVSPSSLILSKVRNLVIAGQLEPLEELLSSTPNFFIDAILKAGWTALMYASYRGYPDIVQFCLKRGADPNYHKEFFTSLMAICSSGNGNEGQLTQCMALLVQSGALVNAVDKFGCSPLHYAARFGRAKLTEQLIENGADVNHSNRNGWTALHWAAAENHEEVVATLLDHNVDVLLETRDGVTAGELAAIRKNKYIAEALQDFEQSELKIMAETAKESEVLLEPTTKNETSENNENTVSLQSKFLPEDTSEQKQEIKRNLSEEEIESRKEEAREIVINAIDAALARDIGKLMSPLANYAENKLRKRPDVLPESEDNNAEISAQNENISTTTENTINQSEVNAHNIVMSLAIAAAIFFFFKLMWYFS